MRSLPHTVHTHKEITDCNYLLNLVKDAIAGRQIAGIDETHFLFIGVIEETPLKVQQWSLHHNIRNNTPINKEK